MIKKTLLFLLFLLSTSSFDNGCNEELPHRCPNSPTSTTPICKRDYQECEGFQGCTDPKYPFLCSNGECNENFYQCSERYFICENSKHDKCQDGLCREDCSQIRYSSCAFSTPIRCPDGKCVTTEVHCASPRCNPDTPFMCPDGTCKGSFFLCEYPQNILIAKTQLTNSTAKMNMIFVQDQNNKHLMTLQVTDEYRVNLKGIAISEIKNFPLEYQEIYEPIFNEYFLKKGKELESYEFIRSTIFDLKAFGNKESFNNKPIWIELKVDYVYAFSKMDKIFNRSDLYCLSKLVDQVWKCQNQHEKNHVSKYVKYKITSDGIYAVTFTPSMEPTLFKEEVYCGLVCKDRRLTFLFIFIGLPLLCVIMYIFHLLYEKKLQEDNLNMKNIFVEKKIKEIENVNVDFAGQTIFEKVEEGVQYFVNPIRNDDEKDLADMKDLNKQKEQLLEEKQKLQKTKREMIAKNKKKIEEIRKLRKEIDELGDKQEQMNQIQSYKCLKIKKITIQRKKLKWETGKQSI